MDGCILDAWHGTLAFFVFWGYDEHSGRLVINALSKDFSRRKVQAAQEALVSIMLDWIEHSSRHRQSLAAN